MTVTNPQALQGYPDLTTYTLAGSVTAGDLIVTGYQANDSVAPGSTPSATVGGVSQVMGSISEDSFNENRLFYFVASTSGVCTVTWDQNLNPTAWTIAEYAGFTTWVLDQHNRNSNGAANSTFTVSSTGATAVNDELAVALLGDGSNVGGFTAGSGATFAGTPVVNGHSIAQEWVEFSSIQNPATLSCTVSTPQAFRAILVTFQDSSSGTVGTPRHTLILQSIKRASSW